jgi:hypothetical protein
LEIISIDYRLIRMIDQNSHNKEFRGLESGKYFIVKRVIGVEEKYLSNQTIILYYRPIFEISNITTYDINGESIDELSFRKIYSGTYRNPGWSAKFCDSTFKDYQKIEFARYGVFEVEKEYENSGLGSYLLDSLLIWSQQQSLTAKVDINRSGVPSDSENYHKKLKHFYDKRNIFRDIPIGETISCMDDTKRKIEEIESDEAIIKLTESIADMDRELKDFYRHTIRTRDILKFCYDREFVYQVFILGLSTLLLSFISIALKFKITIIVCLLFVLFKLSSDPFFRICYSMTGLFLKFGNRFGDKKELGELD